MISNAAIVTTTIIVIVVVMLVVFDFKKYIEDTRASPYGIFITLLIGILVAIVSSWDIPAIEVYRGNTTLEITYRDSIPVDSAVVYKNR